MEGKWYLAYSYNYKFGCSINAIRSKEVPLKAEGKEKAIVEAKAEWERIIAEATAEWERQKKLWPDQPAIAFVRKPRDPMVVYRLPLDQEKE